MANHKSAKKRARQTIKRSQINSQTLSKIRTDLNNFSGLLKDKNKEEINNNPVVICVFDNKNISKYNELIQKLRSANINSEIYLDPTKNLK